MPVLPSLSMFATTAVIKRIPGLVLLLHDVAIRERCRGVRRLLRCLTRARSNIQCRLGSRYLYRLTCGSLGLRPSIQLLLECCVIRVCTRPYLRRNEPERVLHERAIASTRLTYVSSLASFIRSSLRTYTRKYALEFKSPLDPNDYSAPPASYYTSLHARGCS